MDYCLNRVTVLGPTLLEFVASDPWKFNCLAHHTWLQILTGELDPLNIIPTIESITHEGETDAAFDALVDSIVDACALRMKTRYQMRC